MVFSSVPFIFYFLPLFLIIYFIVPKRAKNMVLLIFSLVFYGWGEPVYIILLLISSVVDYINGLMMEKFDNKPKARKLFLVISIIVNIGLLSVFKYADLFISTLNGFTGVGISLTKLPLPIGISFFTFQTMSYSIDVYKRKVEADHNFINYMTYVSMFPQLVAGPIVRYEDVRNELKDRKVTFDGFCDGMIRFGIGLFKKVLIANQVGALWELSVGHIDKLSVLGSWLAILGFALQIYFDFSGYSDMAIGLGKAMGFNYPENFNYPYTATSITDFWRRWHMTLSGWFKLYVYIPLGGNRVGVPRGIINLLIVWALTGFWHGAGWNFILWGIYFAILLVIEKYIIGKRMDKIPKVIRHLIACILILISWVMFQVEEFSNILIYYKTMFLGNGNGFIDKEFLFNISNYGIILVFALVLCTPIYPKVVIKVNASKYKNVWYIFAGIGFIALFIVSVSFIVKNTYNPFLYFRF